MSDLQIQTEFSPELIADKVMEFSQLTTHITLYPYQYEFGWRIVHSLAKGDAAELTCLISRQAGKTEAVAVVVPGILTLFPKLAEVFPEEMGQFQEGVWIGVFAPILDQAKTTYDRIKMRMNTPTYEEVLRDPELETKIVGHGVKLDNGSYVRMMSASRQSSIESKTYHLIFCEEAQGILEYKVLKEIHPMLAATAGTIVKIGTPQPARCEFLNAIKRNKRLDSSVRVKKYRHHFEYDYTICQKYNPRYKEFIKTEKQRIGANSDYFKMSYKLVWPIDIRMFISDEMLDKCTDSALSLGVPKVDTEYSYTFGLDLGKEHDSTVLTVIRTDMSQMDENGMYTKYITAWLEFRGEDYESQYWSCMEFLEDYNLVGGCIDGTSVGIPVVDRFRDKFEEKSVMIEGVAFSLQSKSLMYRYLLDELKAVRLIIPYAPRVRRSKEFHRFKQQMLDLEKTWKGSYLSVGHPDEKDAHDDYCDSLALANWAAREMVFRTIEVSQDNWMKNEVVNPIFKRRGYHSRRAVGGL